MSRIDLDVHFLEQQIADLVLQYPELAEDESLKADVVEGEINVEAVMSRVIDHILEADMMLEGMKIRYEDLTERKKRWERRKEFCRALAQRVLEASGRASIQLPEATVSKSVGRDSVEITDIDSLGQGFYQIEKKPNKVAIKASLDAGEAVPGAAIKKGEPSITVRTK